MYLQLYRSAILCTLAFFFSPSIANANSYLRGNYSGCFGCKQYKFN
jgi:hypothetical protein